MINITKNTPLNEILKLAHPCRCDACSVGCKFGSGFLIGNDEENISNFLKISKKELREKYLEEKTLFNTRLLRPKLETKNSEPYGKCTFFDEKIGCKVHEAKPLQCKIAMGCKDYGEDLMIWFMHNYMINEDDENSVKEFDVYIKSGGKKLPE